MVISPIHKAQIYRMRWIQFSAFIIAMSFLSLVILKVNNILVSCVLALVISYIISPLVDFFERRGLNRNLSVIVTYGMATLGLIFVIVALSPFVAAQISTLKMDLPKYISGTTNLIEEYELTFQDLTGSMFDISFHNQAETFLFNFTKNLFEDLPTFLSKSLTTILLAPFFAYFLLRDGRSIGKNLFAKVPNNIFELTLNLQHQISHQIAQFVRARLLEAAIVGLIILIGLWSIGFPYASLLAIFAAGANLIPYVGPIIGAIPAIAISVVNGDPVWAMLLLIFIYGFAQFIDIAFIIPFVVAKLVNLHPVTVVIVIIIGAQVLGVVGMLVSIPLASAIKVTFTNVYEHLTGLKTDDDYL